MQIEIKNKIIKGYNNEPIAVDVFFDSNEKKKPLVIYAHGFNGFKDWGNFDNIASQFADAGFVFIKFNFSHNGTTPQSPETFERLDLFGKNNYSIELFDLKQVIDFAMNNSNADSFEINKKQLYLIGHSLGGGISIITASEDPRVKGLITWASVQQLKTPWTTWKEEKLNEWKETGVSYILNGRTKQQMPLNYQLYEDWSNNKVRLDIDAALRRLKIPMLICHGTNDEAVDVSVAHHFKTLKPDAELFVTDSDHVFGRKHPWTEKKLPTAMQLVVDRTIEFCKGY